MMTYLLITLLAVLIFLCIPDVVQVVTQGTAELAKARVSSKKHLRG